jgi:hypothetical protein
MPANWAVVASPAQSSAPSIMQRSAISNAWLMQAERNAVRSLHG